MSETAGLEDFLHWLDREPPSFTLLAVKAPIGHVTGMLADSHGPQVVIEEATVRPVNGRSEPGLRSDAESRSDPDDGGPGEEAAADAADSASAGSRSAGPEPIDDEAPTVDLAAEAKAIREGRADAEATPSEPGPEGSTPDEDTDAESAPGVDFSEAETSIIATSRMPFGGALFGSGSTEQDWLAVIRLRDDPWTFVYGPMDDPDSAHCPDSAALLGEAGAMFEEQAEDLSETLGTDTLVVRAWPAVDDPAGLEARYVIFSEGERTEAAEWRCGESLRLFESISRKTPEIEAPDLGMLDRMLRDRGIYVPACRVRVRADSASLGVAAIDPARIERADLLQLTPEPVWPEDETLDLRVEEIRHSTAAFAARQSEVAADAGEPAGSDRADASAEPGGTRAGSANGDGRSAAPEDGTGEAKADSGSGADNGSGGPKWLGFFGRWFGRPRDRA